MRPMVGVLAVFYDAKDHSMTSRTFARARTDRARSRASERRRRRRRSTSRPHREVFFSEGLFTDHDSSIVPFFRVCLTTTHGSRSVEGLARSRSRVTTQKRVPHHRAPLASPRLASFPCGATTRLERDDDDASTSDRVGDARRETRGARAIDRASDAATNDGDETRRDEEDRADRNGRTGTRARGGGGGRARERGARTNERTSD